MLSLFNSFITFVSNTFVSPIMRHKRRSIVIALIIAAFTYVVFFTGSSAVTEPTTTAPAIVSLMNVGDIASESSFSAVGTVQAVSEAQLKAEAGGQVTGVYTEIGKFVRAGAILAQTENARESASLLQAQGSYEAAKAGTAQGDSGVRDAENGLMTAKNSAVTTYKSTYTSVSGALFSTIDQFFANPESSLPGVRIGGADTTLLNTTRVQLQTDLKNLQQNTATFSTGANLASTLDEAENVVKKVLAITDSFITGLNSSGKNKQYSDDELRGLISSLNGVRSGLIGNLSAINGARSGLTAAAESVRRSELTGSGNGATLSGAQLKIALGSLRSAQAAYEKTLVRTPISGVVNALYIKKGDYVTPGADAALIANNKGLQIETAINQADRDLISIGEKVTVNDTATGTIAAIAGAVDPKTGKITVKISLPDDVDLENGTVAKITLLSTKVTTSASKPADLKIPLTAIKLAASGPQVFIVNQDSKLEAKEIILGPVAGDTVLVTAGLKLGEEIVLDVRGHQIGEKVTVTTK